MEKIYQYLPQEFVTFVLVTLFSLLIGLSQRRISLKREGETTLFGTLRLSASWATCFIFLTRRNIAFSWAAGRCWVFCWR